MKMRKLLASAVAASVAVTSLATVASAAEKPFQLGYTTGTVDFTMTSGMELDGMFSLSQEQIDAGETLGISDKGTMVLSLAGTKDVDKITGVTLNVTGVKGTRGNSTKTYSYAFKNTSDAEGKNQVYDGNGKYYALDAFNESASAGSFIPSQFVEITKIELVVTAERYEETAEGYDFWGSDKDGAWYTDKQGSSVSTVASYWDGTNDVDTVLDVINKAAWSFWGANYAGTKKTTVNYPFLEQTTENAIMKRVDIWKLTESGAHTATGGAIKDDVDGNQSYNGDDTTAGDTPAIFAGLSSQVADFFNKQSNGTITFKFTAPAAAAAGSEWVTGGIPSTQTGVKNTLDGASANNFALFFNYEQTGSLQAVTSIDHNAGTVTFDITNILDALGGQTLGVLDNIYYGLNKGIDYTGDAYGKGLYVESVTLAYDDDADVEADIEDDTDDAEIEDDTTVEEDDDVELEDDADDAEEDDTTDEETDGDVIVENEDDDANPGTGVALAVVPALVAAAAVVVSKKRS